MIVLFHISYPQCYDHFIDKLEGIVDEKKCFKSYFEDRELANALPSITVYS